MAGGRRSGPSAASRCEMGAWALCRGWEEGRGPMVVVGRLRAGWGTPFCLCLLSHFCAPTPSCSWRGSHRETRERAGGCVAVLCNTDCFSFLPQIPSQQQRWLRQTLCLSPWAPGRYVLAPAASQVWRWETGRGRSRSSPARKAAPQGVRPGEPRKRGTGACLLPAQTPLGGS